MFKSKSKKAEELPERSQTPQPTKSKKKLFGRRKEEPEPVPQLDLSAALPSSDNFRTSLLMNSLSTRFSMLREQDDPNSMLGKAMDDSVLHSHRKSKLGGFGDTGLFDIAETASITSAIRPPFASNGRSTSYATDASIGTMDDDSSTNGSIMGRSRPGEGNMLFGGRQKIYKIPIGDAGSVRALGGQEQRGMRGRALYEDDVHMSAFQKYKEEERRAERERKLEALERDMLNDEMGDSSMNSPSLSTFDEKRVTTSSTGSGPSRMSGSTAATSVMSHGPNAGSATQSPMTAMPPSAGLQGLGRSNSRRLYDMNLDQNMLEQQSANLSRMNSMQRKASNGPVSRSALHGSRSATNLRERFGPPVSSESSRAASPLPPPPEMLTTFNGLKAPGSSGHSPVSPHTPVFNDPENPLNQAVDARDRGKATALGQFNRPKQFDEQQFLQRQRSLHQQNILRNDSRSPRPMPGRPSNDGRRPSVENKSFFPPPRRPSEEARSRAGSAQGYRPGFNPRPRAGTGQSNMRPMIDTRARAGTNRTDSSRPSMEARTPNYSGPPSPATRRDFSAEARSPMTASPTKGGRQEPTPRAPQGRPRAPSSLKDSHGTGFYDSPVTTNDSPLLGTEQTPEASPKISLERGTVADVPPPLRSPPPMHDHPALRGASSGEDTPMSPLSPSREDRRKAVSPDVMMENFKPPVSRGPSDAGLPEIDVDTVADATDADRSASTAKLNGMIREHLRQPSNVSSIYPMHDDDPARQSILMDENAPPSVPAAFKDETNPWLAGGEPGPTTDGFGHANLNPDNIGVAVASPSDQTNPPMELPPGPRPGDADDWMNELRKQHTRDISTETQHERKAFAEDIRIRQKAIQENLRIKNEIGARSPSPGHVKEKQNMFENGLRPFGLLRKQSSHDDLNRRKQGLGISRPMNGSGRSTPVGPPGRPQGPPPMGRTLHMRMPPSTRQSEESFRGRSQSRPRNTSKASDANSMPYRTPPESGRTSTSNDVPSGRQSEAGSDIRRSEFPSGFQSVHPSARPSLDTMRQRSDSGAIGRDVPPVPPLRTNNGNPTRPPMASLSTTTSVPSTTTVSPIQSNQNTPPLSATSMSSPDLRGQTNTTLAQIPHTGAVSPAPVTLPQTTYNFPARAEKDRPAAVMRRTGRSNTINKGDISVPTLISSTSNFETMELEEKRKQLQAMSIGNISVQSPPPIPQTEPMASPTRRGFFGRKSSEQGAISGDDSSGNSYRTKNSKDSEEDDFITRPGAGRMRIRKVSSESNGFSQTRRHEAVQAGLVEGDDRSIAGGMF